MGQACNGDNCCGKDPGEVNPYTRIELGGGFDNRNDPDLQDQEDQDTSGRDHQNNMS